MVLGGALRTDWLAKILGAILFLALLHQPVPGFGATVSGQYSLTLNWQRSSSPGIAGYRVYYGTASQNYPNVIELADVATYTVTGLTGGVTYYFALTAFDTNGTESVFSNEYIFTPGLSNVQLRAGTNGQFVLTLSGLINRSYDILATQDFSAWTVIGTVTLDAGGSLDFTDTNAASFPQRYYRTQLKP